MAGKCKDCVSSSEVDKKVKLLMMFLQTLKILVVHMEFHRVVSHMTSGVWHISGVFGSVD